MNLYFVFIYFSTIQAFLCKYNFYKNKYHENHLNCKDIQYIIIKNSTRVSLIIKILSKPKNYGNHNEANL